MQFYLKNDEVELVHVPNLVVFQSYSNEEWSLQNLTTISVLFSRFSFGNEPINFPALRVDIVLKRVPSYYFWNLIVPVLVVSYLGIFSWILPPDSGNRNYLVITILLSFLFIQTIIANVLPKSGQIPEISKYLISSLIISAFNLVYTVFLNCIFVKNSNDIPTRGINFVVFDIIGLLVLFGVRERLRKYSNKTQSTTSLTSAQIELEEINENNKKGDRLFGKRDAVASIGKENMIGNQKENLDANLKCKENLAVQAMKSWQDVAIVLNRFGGIIYIICTCLAFFFFLFPLLLKF